MTLSEIVRYPDIPLEKYLEVYKVILQEYLEPTTPYPHLGICSAKDVVLKKVYLYNYNYGCAINNSIINRLDEMLSIHYGYFEEDGSGPYMWPIEDRDSRIKWLQDSIKVLEEAIENQSISLKELCKGE